MPFLITKQGVDTADKIQLLILYIVQLFLIGTIIWSVIQKSWFTTAITAGILILTFVPMIIRKNWNVYLPVEFDLLFVLFVFTSLFLGEIHTYYARFWWWDIVLHTGSGFLLGIAGFLLMYILNEEDRIHVRLKPGFVALFGFAFAVMFGAVWEIFEFSMDSLFGFTMQKAGLVDTMWDLIVDTLGASVIALFGYFSLKKGGFVLFDRMIHRFVDKNPGMFKRKGRRR